MSINTISLLSLMGIRAILENLGLIVREEREMQSKIEVWSRRGYRASVVWPRGKGSGSSS